jgi:type VI secretion system protein ImpC
MLPLEALVPDQLHWDLADQGFLALTCSANSDAALVLTAPTIHRPERYPDQRATSDSVLRATLPYQLAVSRIAQYVGHLYTTIVPGNTPEGIEHGFARALWHLLDGSGELAADAVRVAVSVSTERHGCYDLSLSVRPGRQVLGGRAIVELAMQTRL